MRDPNGNNPRTIYRDDSYIRSTGLRMQLTPDGDCREAVFDAKGAGLRVPPLSNVQVEYLHGGVWTPLYYGEVRMGGNSRDVNGERYVLRSLARRLAEITLPPGFTTPQQPAHLTVRAILRAVADSGQLGTFPAIEYDEQRCPDLGFDCRAIADANQQNPAALLEQVAQDGAGLGVTVAWGVGPDRFFFCRPARVDVAELEAPTGNPLTPSSTVALTWQPPVAETPCTGVLWFIGKREDGSPITHLSLLPDANVWGMRVKPLSLDASVPAWASASLGAQGLNVQPIDPNHLRVLTDRVTLRPDGTREVVIGRGVDGAQPGYLDIVVLDLPYVGDIPPSATRTEVDAYWAPPTASGARLELRRPGPAGDLVRPIPLDTTSGASLLRGTFYAPDWDVRTGDVLRFYFGPGETVYLSEVRPELPDALRLRRLAQYHRSTPAQDPADIETATFRPPRDLTGRARVRAMSYERAVEAWEYRLTAARGLTLAALTGQADDPAKLAQASLIKARDGQATINALTAQT